MIPLLLSSFFRRGVGVFAMLAVGSSWTMAELRHDMYLCTSMSGAFVIGMATPRLHGVYRSADREEIEHVGFNHPRLDALVADPRDPAVLYTAGLNGVMRSLDQGGTWRIMTSWDMTEPKDLVIDPHHPARLYAALPDGIGVSDDRGQSWRRLRTGIARPYTQALVVDRSEPGRILAATELGIYLGEPGTENWKRVLTTEATVTDLQQSPRDPAHLVATTQADGAWESRDRGRTWQRLRGLPREHTLHNIVFAVSTPGLLAVSGWGLGVQVSEDDGRTWQNRSAGLPNAEVWRVAADPDLPSRLYASPHQAPIYVSDDAGRTWRAHWFEGATVWDVTFVPRAEGGRP